MKKLSAWLALGAPLLVAGSAHADLAVVHSFAGSSGAGGTVTALGSGVVSSVSFPGAASSSLSLHDASGTTVLASSIAGRTGKAFAIGNGRAIVSFVESGAYVLPGQPLRTTFWSTDGTAAGTFELPVAGTTGVSGTQGTSVQVLGGGVVLSGVPTETGAWEAWWSDGTVAGTHRIGRMCAEPIGFFPLGASGSRAYVGGIACETSDGALYVVDSGGLSVLDFGSFSSQVATWNAAGSTVFFDVRRGATWQWGRGDGASPPVAEATWHGARHYDSVWSLGGSAFAATSSAVVAADGTDTVVAAVSSASLLGIAGGRMVFAGGPSDARALWSSDGLPSGTRSLGQVVDPGSFAAPRPLVEYSAVATLASSVLFFANARGAGNLPSRDRELWTTDGTTTGTRRLFAKSGGPYLQPTGVMVGSASVFLFDGDVWRSDGTADGTAQIAAMNGQSVALATAGETLYMLVGAPGGSALWSWTAQTSPPAEDGGAAAGGSRGNAAGPGKKSSSNGASANANANASASGCSLGARSERRSESGVGVLMLGLALMVRRRAHRW